MGQLISSFVQLSVADLLLFEDYCHLLRRTRHLLLEEFMHAGLMRIVSGGIIPFHQ